MVFWKTMFRHFRLHSTYTALSLGGLVIGLTTTLLIFLWTFDELSYDRHHPDNARVFQVMLNAKEADGHIETIEETPHLLAEYLKSEVPEVEVVCRTGYWERLLISNGDKAAYFDGRFADPTFVSVFNMKLLSGDAASPLPDNHSIILARTTANLLFENGDALGKTVKINEDMEVKVSGIFEDHPRTSSLSEEFLMPIYYHLHEKEDSWRNTNVATYVKLREADAAPKVTETIKDKINQELKSGETSLFLFAITDWRLHYRFVDGKISGGRIEYVIAFSLVAVFILIMACINYMNLATARAAMRAKEIGVRKMSGATHKTLVRQFLAESLTITFAASAITLLVVYLVMPLFRAMTGKPLSFDLFDPVMLSGLLIISMIAGLLAGSYPAFVLASLKPSAVLKGNLYEGLTGASLRKGLVIFQFSLSLILICAAVVIQQQIEFLRTRDLGFDQKNILYIQPGPTSDLSTEAFRAEALRNPHVQYVVEGAASPMEINGYGPAEWNGKSGAEEVLFNGASCDYDYLPALGFKFVKGRNFSRDYASDSSGYVITQRAAEIMGFDDPIGQRITFEEPGTIIGVIEDFNNANIQETTAPVIFYLGNKETFGRWKRIFVRYEPGSLTEVMEHLKAVHEKLQPGIPPEFGFLDRDFESQFRSENLLGRLATAFTVIAVSIACLGLFGLTLFSTQRRTKEIGVRKVLGATIPGLVMMFCKDFSRPVMLSIVVAVPVAYWLMEQFLQRYPLHLKMPWASFAITSVALLGLALLTVSYQSLRAARQNPVEALKTE